MIDTSEIVSQIVKLLDDEVRDLSQADYAEVLDELGSDIDARLDCVREEMAAAEDE